MILLAAVLIFLAFFLLLWILWPDEPWHLDDDDCYEISPLWRSKEK